MFLYERDIAMCDNSKSCEKPEELKGKPEDCSAEQIEKCHGGEESHPCCPNPPQDKAKE